jgi:UDP-glucose:(heptosyl)LPS alpha-1,3-glucosyltransferase
VFVGGDWERKGLRHAIEALELAPSWRLLVVGDGDVKRYRAIARTSGVEAKVRFEGRQSDVARLYAAGDAFVLPTAYEAFPLVSLEAAAAGLPLLISRVNGVEELLEPGRNGWFIARDRHDIAARLRALEANPDLMQEMRARAMRAISRYAWSQVVDSYARVYHDLVAASR